MEKIVCLFMLIFVISCGNPVNSDKNIIKEKIDSEDEFARPTELNSEWEYSIDAEYTVSTIDNLPGNYPNNLTEILTSENSAKGENWYISNINGNDVNVQVGEDFIYYEVDEFEKLVLPVQVYTDLYINVDSEIDWTYNGVNYKYLGESNITINSNNHKVKSVEFTNPNINATDVNYTKKIFYNKEIGIARIEYTYDYPTRQTKFNLKLDLLSFK